MTKIVASATSTPPRGRAAHVELHPGKRRTRVGDHGRASVRAGSTSELPERVHTQGDHDFILFGRCGALRGDTGFSAQ
jgi:hypothetical protein